tara:strand:+ start:346 stop:567 length:222 start_codon:yes stop_codon:yes gene_type:complete
MQDKLNVDINQTQGVSCDECGSTFFQQGLVIRKASGILTGTGQTSYIPIPIFSCTKCGHVNGEFLPKEIKDLG